MKNAGRMLANQQPIIAIQQAIDVLAGVRRRVDLSRPESIECLRRSQFETEHILGRAVNNQRQCLIIVPNIPDGPIGRTQICGLPTGDEFDRREKTKLHDGRAGLVDREVQTLGRARAREEFRLRGKRDVHRRDRVLLHQANAAILRAHDEAFQARRPASVVNASAHPPKLSHALQLLVDQTEVQVLMAEKVPFVACHDRGLEIGQVDRLHGRGENGGEIECFANTDQPIVE